MPGGFALNRAQDWFEAQGADPNVLVRPDKLPRAPIRRRVDAPGDGWVAEIHAETVGRVVIALGGGRERKEDAIDSAVGVEVHTEVGRRVTKDQPVFTIHARNELSSNLAAEQLKRCLKLSPDQVEPVLPVIEVQ